MRGALNMASQYYNMAFSVKQFPLNKFLKGSGLGELTTTLSARGLKFNPLKSGAKASLSLSVDSLHYNRYDYTDMNLDLKLSEGLYNGTLITNCEALKTALTLSGVLTEAKQTLNLKGDIPNVDLQKMNYVSDRLSFTSSIDISALADTFGVYSLNGGLGTTTVRMFGAKRTLPGLSLDMLADTSQVRANLDAKGLFFDFKSPVSLNNFIAGVDTVMVELKSQSDSLMYNIADIKNI